ncbi:hypothetical protein CKM354_001009600 [Cercospora kikuchii]|uniref:F-box domain-containing protein n=1 Tax=Cercospora kikuchii TaxID=84275 RepID=A0A9P3FKE9_9PEZI|nr:uncharacterized protein CKM354_001009600 [Cercospora kikuchii]GIZ46994.1 hypothetical protein CKM354_001009600 [Cercospora kikuchii]
MTNSEKRRKRKAERQEPGRPPAKQIKFKEHFIKMLAPELQLDVLSYLSVTDIQKCRRVNRYMRDLIDNPANQVICAAPSIAQARKKFDEFIKSHIEYDVDAVDEAGNPCGFLNALVAYTKSHGICQSHCELHVLQLEDFAAHWIERWQPGPEVPQENRCSAVMSAAAGLHALHMLREGLRHSQFGRIGVGKLEFILELHITHELFGVSREQCSSALFQKIAAGAFEGTRCHERGESLGCVGCRSPSKFKLAGVLSQLERSHYLSAKANEDVDEYIADMRNGARLHGHALATVRAALEERKREEASWTEVRRKEQPQFRNPWRSLADVQDSTDRVESYLAQPAMVQGASISTHDGANGDDALPQDSPFNQGDEVGALLFELFELPKLPDNLEFAYYGRSRRLVSLMKEVMQGEKKLTPLRKAAILDSITIW